MRPCRPQAGRGGSPPTTPEVARFRRRQWCKVGGPHGRPVRHAGALEVLSSIGTLLRIRIPPQHRDVPARQTARPIGREEQIKNALNGSKPEAIIIRTIPNFDTKKSKKYSNTNWAYLLEEAAAYIKEVRIKHLLIDLPSVDREKDEGELLAHKAFWNYPLAPRLDATITEFIYVPTSILDGCYMLNLQIASFENDATPSKPILYEFI